MSFAVVGVLAYLALGLVGLLRGGKVTGLSAIAVGVVTLILWAPGFPPALLGEAPWGITLVGDRVALAFWALAPLAHAAVWWTARRRPGTFHALVTLLVGTCLATVISKDLFNLYVLLDLGSLLTVVLLSYDQRSRAVWAALQYLFLSAVGMILYLLGVALVYGHLGTLSLVEIAKFSSGFSSPALAVGAGLLVAGAAVKAGVFLLGFWLPAAYRHAPTEAVILFATLSGKMGIVALARLAEAFPVGVLLTALGVITGFGGLLYALWEKDLKLFLAYHTISQLGYTLIGLGFGGAAAQAGILFAIAHCLFKGLLFLAGGQAVDAVGARELPELVGKVPSAAAWGLAMGTASIVGVPPLAAFVAKEFLGLTLPAGFSWVLFSLSLGTAASFAKIIPLLRPGPGKVERGGLILLTSGLMAFSLWGLVSLPELWKAAVWGKALAAVAAGYGVYFLARRFQPKLPRLTMERALVLIFIVASALSLSLLFS
ncbi:hypothetical protein H5T56_04300 [Candidatus Bipolaricaulota bacterium]|nr:hypothetical protein [Candidatus Bipolaricaulota bacterium]